MKKGSLVLLIFCLLFIGTASSLFAQEVVFSESFDSATIPEGWTTEEFNFPTQNYVWRFNDPGNKRVDFTGEHNISGNFAIIDSHNYGYPGVMNAVLTTPAIDFSGLFNATLSFDQCRRLTTGVAFIQISTDGTIWNNVVHFNNQEGYTTPVNSSYDISNYIANQSEVYIRWKWEASYVFWAIDNVEIITQPNPDYPLPARPQYPANNQAFVPLDTPLEWLPESGGAEPTGYKLYLGTTSPPPLLADLGYVLSYQPEIEINQRYFWRIVPYNDAGSPAINDCSLWNFSTYQAIPEGTYVVNADGTGDYENLNEVITSLHSNGVSGPVVFQLAPGDYQGPFVIQNINGASETNTVTIDSEDEIQAANLTRASTTTSSRHILRLQGTRHIRLNNLNFTISVASNGWAINIINNSNDIQITNSNFLNESTTNNEFIAAPAGQWENGLAVNNLLIEGCNFVNGNIAVIVNGDASSYLTRIRIRNNKFTNMHRGGIHVNHLDSYEMSGNIVEMKPDGDTESFGVTVRNSKGNFTFSKNRIFNARRWGLRYGTHIEPDGISMIVNNMIGGGFTASDYYNAIGALVVDEQINDVGIFYNSFNLDSPAAANWDNYTSTASMHIAAASRGLRILNNSFAYTGGGRIGRAFHLSSVSVEEFDHNNFYSNGTTSLAWYNTFRTNLAAIQSVDNRNQNSRVGDPEYLSSTDLHSYGSQLYTGGVPIQGVETDIDGDQRDPNMPCIGADEYEPMFDRDLAAISISGPNLIYERIPVTHQVKVENQGYLFQSEFTLFLMRSTGVTLATLDIDQPIFPGEEIVYDLTWTPPSTGIYDIYGLVVLQNDQNPNNNATSMMRVMVRVLDTLQTPGLTITREGNSATLSWEPIPVAGIMYKVFFSDSADYTDGEEWDLLTTTYHTSINISMINPSNFFYVTAFLQTREAVIDLDDEEEEQIIPEQKTTR